MGVDTRIGGASTILRELFRSVDTKQELNARAGHHSGRYSFGHNSPAAAAREVFKPSTYSACLLVATEKKFFQKNLISPSTLGLGLYSGVIEHET